MPQRSLRSAGETPPSSDRADLHSDSETARESTTAAEPTTEAVNGSRTEESGLPHDPVSLTTDTDLALQPEFNFIELLDAVFGRQSSDNNSPAALRGTISSSADGNATAAGGEHMFSAAGAETIGATSVEIPLATVSSEMLDDADNGGAIVITVNYMFMEGGDQGNPGRTGSLVVTLPNNATNREPRVILQFISLATRMAYSALVTNAPKVHPGVTLDKFNSFAVKAANELSDTTCSICFEEFETSPEILTVPESVLESVASKKRKLGVDSHCVSASSSTDRLPDTASSSNEATSNPETPSGTFAAIGENEETRPKYLCEHNEEYGHTPLQMPCGHVFGQSCLSHWLKENTSCPLCRVSVGEARQRPQVAPISYIRFGGLNNSGEESRDSPTSTGNDDARGDSAPGIFDRATLVLFNPLLAMAREAPPTPLMPQRNQRRTRNSSVSPVIDNILSYFSRARRQSETDSTGSNSLFASGVSSRRTADGVETVTSDNFSPYESFPNFILPRHHGSDSYNEENSDNASNGSDDSNNNNHNDSEQRSNGNN